MDLQPLSRAEMSAVEGGFDLGQVAGTVVGGSLATAPAKSITSGAATAGAAAGSALIDDTIQ